MSLKFQTKVSKFNVRKINYYEYHENPIIKIGSNNNGLIALIKNEGPVEIWKVNKQSFYLHKKIFLPSNFIADTLCWLYDCVFLSGITGQIMVSKVHNVPQVINGNSGSIWCLEADVSGNYLSAGTEEGSVIIYKIQQTSLKTHYKNTDISLEYLHKVQPTSLIRPKNKQERVCALSWKPSKDANIQSSCLAFATAYNTQSLDPDPDENKGLVNDIESGNVIPLDSQNFDIANSASKNRKKHYTRNSGKIFIWDVTFLPKLHQDPVGTITTSSDGTSSGNDDEDVNKTSHGNGRLITKRKLKSKTLQKSKSFNHANYKVIDLEFLAREEYNQIITKNSAKSSQFQTSLFITCMRYLNSSTENILVTGDTYGFVRVWDTANANLRQSFACHKAAILDICFEENNPNSFYAAGVDPLIQQFERRPLNISTPSKFNEKHQASGEWQKSNHRNLHINDVKALVHTNSWLISGGLDSKLVFSRFPPKTIVEIPYIPNLPFDILCCRQYNTQNLQISGQGSDVQQNHKNLVLLKYSHKLEIWEVSHNNAHNPLFDNNHIDNMDSLEGVLTPCITDTSVGFNSVRLLEFHTNRNVKIPLDITCSDFSNNAKFLACADNCNTHLYYIALNHSDGTMRLNKIRFLTLNNTLNHKKKKQKITSDHNFSINQLSSPNYQRADKFTSQFLRFITLPAYYFSQNYRKETFKITENGPNDQKFSIKSSKNISFNNNFNNDITGDSVEGLIRVARANSNKTFIHIYPIKDMNYDCNSEINLATPEENLCSQPRYFCDLSNKITIPFPEDVEDTIEICALEYTTLLNTQSNGYTENADKGSYIILALSFYNGVVAIYSFDQAKYIWRLDRNDMPCFKIRFHPLEPEILLLYPDNKIYEFNYYNGEPTLWSTMFNSTFITVKCYKDGENKKIKNSSKFTLPWVTKIFKKMLKTTESTNGSEQPVLKNSESTLTCTYPVLRDIFYNPQNLGQLITYDMDTIYSISKRGCCVTNYEMQSENDNQYPPINEIKSFKYIGALSIIDHQSDILVVEITPESISASSILPALKKKTYGV